MKTDSREILALGMFGHRSWVAKRIEMLLAGGRVFSSRASMVRVAMSVGVMLGFVVAGSGAPRWIAFAKQSPPVIAVVRFTSEAARPGGAALAIVPPNKGPGKGIARQIPATPVPKAAESKFEVVSVRAAKPGQGKGRGGNGPYVFNTDPGMLVATNVTLKTLFQQAYSLKAYQLGGAPDWLTSNTYDVNGKAAAESTREETMVMLRSVLAERFHLKFHVENKPLDVMALVVAKGGPKFHEAQSAKPSDAQATPASFGMSPMFEGRNMDTFANMLSGVCGTLEIPFGPVVDKTGLKGEYDLRTQTRPNPDSGPRSMIDQVCEALPQLGLELKREKIPMDIYVIDSADKIPTEN